MNCGISSWKTTRARPRRSSWVSRGDAPHRYRVALPPKTQRRRLTNQKPEPRPTSAPRTSRNSIAPSVQRLSDRRAPPVVSVDRCLAPPLWSATAAYCCSVLLVACMTYCKPTFLDQWQSVVQPYLVARVPLLLKLRSSVVSQQKCASNRRAVLSTK